MLRVTLDRSPDRDQLDAFVAAVGVLAGGAGGLATWLLSGSAGLALVLAAGVAAGAVGAGWNRPVEARKVYDSWNRLARALARRARRWLSGLCYYAVITGAALVHRDSDFRTGPPSDGRSGWKERGTLPSTAYGSTDRWGRPDGPASSRIREFLRWAWRSGHWWAVTLLPVIVLMKAFERRGGPQDAPSSIYTLY